MGEREFDNMPVSALCDLLNENAVLARFYPLIPGKERLERILAESGVQDKYDYLEKFEGEPDFIARAGLSQDEARMLAGLFHLYDFKSRALSELATVEPDFIARLRAMKIKTSLDYLRLCGKSGYPEETEAARRLFSLCDLMRLPGVKETRAALYDDCGYHGTGDIARISDVSAARAAIARHIEDSGDGRSVPLYKELSTHVAVARALPRLEAASVTALEQKLNVLSSAARALNQKGVCWAVGGSLLLYLNGKTDHFNDIDLVVTREDADKLARALSALGEMLPQEPDARYKTERFMEFKIDGVDVDAMAGMVIVSEGREYDCAFTKDRIAGYALVGGEKIPMQSLSDWRRYYALMGREAKVNMIDEPSEYPYGYCGMPCALCTRYRTEGKSRCPGCSCGGYYTDMCKVYRCCREKGVAHCGLCADFPCARLGRLSDFRDLDTGNVKKRSCDFIHESGFYEWTAQYAQKAELLTLALQKYNNGRMKRYLCELFIKRELPELRALMEKAESLACDPAAFRLLADKE